MPDTPNAARPSAAPDAIATLLENRQTFLAYLQRRVGDRALAEDILQEAFVRNFGKLDALPDEALIPWFLRTLRNAAIDQHRRRASATKALEAFAHELERVDPPAPDIHSAICACVTRLATTLKPEYAEALLAIDVNGTPVKRFAAEKGLSTSNAGVRVFRAREALRRGVVATCGACAASGCRDCGCE